MDGIDAARTMRERGIMTPIIAMTASVGEEGKYAAVGVNDVAQKPFTTQVVNAILNKYCPYS